MAALNASQIQPVQSPTSTWHVGISPLFPPSLVLSNDTAIESLLTDIPFLSTGLLGFGVLTFFFAMRNFDRLAFYVFGSVIMAFVAGVLDVGQVLIRGRVATDADTDVSSVLPLLIARELTLSVSIGIRFFFFLIFVLQPPRGENRLPSRVDSQGYKPSFLWVGSDVHGRSWVGWGYVGSLLKYGLLLAVLAIPILQILWRVAADFSRVGPVYNADSSLEIAISALFVIKLFINASFSPLTPRWKTIRDYLPVIFALLIGLGVGVGNILCFQFSETSLGRFLQAVELYTMVLHTHIASFYTHRSRARLLDSTMQDRASNASMIYKGIDTRDRMSNSEVDPTFHDVPGVITTRPNTLYSRHNDRLSSWFFSDADQIPVVPSVPKRMSTADRLFSWSSSRRNSAKHNRSHSRLWAIDVERVLPRVETKTDFATLPNNKEVREGVTWKNTIHSSAKPVSTLTSQRPERITRVPDTPTSRNDTVSPDGTIASFAGIGNYVEDDFIPLQVPKLPGSPVYGLDGIVRYHGQPSPLSRPGSVQSSGMESLLRQQAELDKSVAELQFFSSSQSRTSASASSGMGLSIPGGKADSVRSDISLSNFPVPPLDALQRLAGVGVSNVSGASKQDFQSQQQADTVAILPLPVIARPPRLSSLTAQSRRQQSFPSASRRSSVDSAMLGVAVRTISGSSGIQYDVTSFIDDLTTPALESYSQSDISRRPSSFAVPQPGVKEVRTAKVEQAAGNTPGVTVQAQVPPLATIAEVEAGTLAKPSAPRRMKQGLPRRIKLNISNPIPRASDERSRAFEHPRPAPLT